MKQKLFIILGLAVLIVVLVGLNAISYTQKEKELDSEFYPNRSTYNPGSTGTRAFFDLLNETGRRAVRWRETPAELLVNEKDKPATFVIVGATRREVTEEDARQLLRWVSDGGKLVIIDRDPASSLVKTTADWHLFFNTDFQRPNLTTDASDQQQMTTGIKAAKPVQPTFYTKGVNGAQPSVFATSVNFDHLTNAEIENKTNGRVSKPTPLAPVSRATPKPEPPRASATPKPTPKAAFEDDEYEYEDEEEAPSGGLGSSTPGFGRGNGAGAKDEPVVVKKAAATPDGSTTPDGKYAAHVGSAPVVHMIADGRNMLVDVPYGAGQIVFLSDPYIVANSGINQVDNAQLALNVIAGRDGVIAFDEYHQGYGANNNRLLQFFTGTPVIPIFLQIALLIGLLFFSQSRRFARAVPEPEPNRLSKLEYVSAMAELQQRTKGYDLAIENIYTDFRRRVSRLVGVDAQKVRKQDLAMLITERLPDENPDALEDLMRRCEDIMHGEATGKKEVLRLTTRLREIEEKLGLQRRKKQKGK